MEDNKINQQAVVEQPRILRRHFMDLLLPFVWSVLMLFPILIINIVTDNGGIAVTPELEFGLWMFGGLYTVFVISFFMTEWIFWYQDAWLITHDRLIDIQMVSLFNRKMSQLTFNQIQDVKVEIQGYLQHIFNFGTVSVQSAGRQGLFQLSSIPRPAAVATEISDRALMSQTPQPNNPEVRMIKPAQRLGEILVAEGKISQDDLINALQLQAGSEKHLGQILVDSGKISRVDLIQALSAQYRIPSIDLARYDLDGNIVRLIPKHVAQQHTAIAVDRSPDGVISIALAHPTEDRISELMSQFDNPLTFLVADEDYIKEVIAGYYTDNSSHNTPNSFSTGGFGG